MSASPFKTGGAANAILGASKFLTSDTNGEIMFAHTMELPSPRVCGIARRSLLKGMPLAALLFGSALCVAKAWSLVATSSSQPVATMAAPALITSVGNRASHNGRYHAEVVSLSSLAVGERQRWTVRVTRRNHRLAHARIAVEAWMPETGVRSPLRSSASYIGGGRYLIDDVSFSRAGWWNVALVIDGRAGTDSLAFNVVVR
jgi:hypothetical protein